LNVLLGDQTSLLEFLVESVLADDDECCLAGIEQLAELLDVAAVQAPPEVADNAAGGTTDDGGADDARWEQQPHHRTGRHTRPAGVLAGLAPHLH
jgi:hypothetical protein